MNRVLTPRSISLTHRQHDVVVLVLEDLTRREIAERLGVREETIAHHLKAVKRKLGADDRPMRAIRRNALALLDAPISARTPRSCVPRETAPKGGIQ